MMSTYMANSYGVTHIFTSLRLTLCPPYSCSFRFTINCSTTVTTVKSLIDSGNSKNIDTE